MQRNIIDLFNSGESEKTFEDDFSEPKMNVKIKLVLNNNMINGVCSAIFDDKFIIRNIKIVRTDDKEIMIIFPYRKTQNDSTINICELINNKDKYCNQITDAYLKMIEDNAGNLNNAVEQSDRNNKTEDVVATGWDAITAEAERVYPLQKNPKHYGTLIKYRLGGKDPIDGFSVYDGGDCWHFVT